MKAEDTDTDTDHHKQNPQTSSSLLKIVLGKIKNRKAKCRLLICKWDPI